MMMREWQFDGIVGPTHNYAGLALGNLASSVNAGAVANPRLAALQGLEKMRFVRDLGMPQAVLPPHYRPALGQLRRLGFTGTAQRMLDAAFHTAPGLLAATCSSSFMWAANAATVTPSVDNLDGRLHLTPANLSSHYHRAMEAEFQKHSLRTIFHNEKLFAIHNYLPQGNFLGDEGAANHMRINAKNSNHSVNIFVYGESSKETLESLHFPARQHLLASQAIARLHGMELHNCLFLQQSPAAINAGVFHNDVIAMSTQSRLISHEAAFIPEHRKTLQEWFANEPSARLYEIKTADLSLKDAVRSYLFNSQLLELAGGKVALIAPSECREIEDVVTCITALKSEGMLDEAHYLDVRESMRNGGGPACLRLRVEMNAAQEAAIHPGVVFTDATYQALHDLITRHYRDRLRLDDFCDPQFLKELDATYDAFERVLGLKGLYDGFRD